MIDDLRVLVAQDAQGVSQGRGTVILQNGDAAGNDAQIAIGRAEGVENAQSLIAARDEVLNNELPVVFGGTYVSPDR